MNTERPLQKSASMVVDLSLDIIVLNVHHNSEASGVKSGETTLILALPTLFTNIVATSIIACTAWYALIFLSLCYV